MTCALRARRTGCESAHHLFTIVLDEGVDRDAFRAALADAARPDERPLPAGPPLLDLRRRRAPSCPLTEAYAARTVTLPMFAHMTDEQQDLVVEAVADALSGAGAPARD